MLKTNAKNQYKLTTYIKIIKAAQLRCSERETSLKLGEFQGLLD